MNFFKKNYLLSVFFALVAFVFLIFFYKLFFAKPTYLFAKVKISQGLWWAATRKPPFYFVKSLKKGMEEKDLTGKPIAKILSIRYYPSSFGNSEYNIYLLMRLKVTKVSEDKYNFKRSHIAIGSPVDFEFPAVQFSATVIDLSDKPIEDHLVEKTVYLQKSFAYPFEYELIGVNDSYFDGQDKVLQVVDKKIINDTWALEEVNFLNEKTQIDPFLVDKRVNLLIKIKVKGYYLNDQFIFGEEEVFSPGKNINLKTNNFYFQDYLISKIE